MSETEKLDDLITAYKRAYADANGKPLAETVSYENGWFVFRGPTGFNNGRYRRAKLQTMRSRLEARAASAPINT